MGTLPQVALSFSVLVACFRLVFVGVLVFKSGSIPVYALSVKNCSVKYLCLFWSNGFVYMSARFFSVGTYLISMSPLVTYPLTKWYRRAMCLFPFTSLLFLMVSIVGWLSHRMVGVISISKSNSICFSHIASSVASVNAISSAFVELLAVIRWDSRFCDDGDSIH